MPETGSVCPILLVRSLRVACETDYVDALQILRGIRLDRRFGRLRDPSGARFLIETQKISLITEEQLPS